MLRVAFNVSAEAKMNPLADLPGFVTIASAMVLEREIDGLGARTDDFDLLTDDPQGVASCNDHDHSCKIPVRGKMNFGTVILYDDIRNAQGGTDLLAAKTMIHETGHLLGAGRNDDDSIAEAIPVEVYSGDSKDHTPENSIVGGVSTHTRSAMTRGYRGEITDPPISSE